MGRNIEVKARIPDRDAIQDRVAAIADDGPTEIPQDDTYFRCDAGRLKLRAFSSENGELVFYRRDDQPGPAESFYLRVPTSAPDALRESLSCAYGVVARVRKQRTLFMVGRTRIHLDRVADLGDYLELEVVLTDDESPDVGTREASDLMARLAIPESQLEHRGYLELVSEQAGDAQLESSASAASTERFRA